MKTKLVFENFSQFVDYMKSTENENIVNPEKENLEIEESEVAEGSGENQDPEASEETQETEVSEGSEEDINEAYPYDQLKKPTPAIIAKALYDAKGTVDDKEAWVVAALMAVADFKSLKDKITPELNKIQKSNGKPTTTTMNWISSFMEGNELTQALHNGKSVFGEIARIYKISDFSNLDSSSVPWKFFKTSPTFKDDLKKIGSKTQSYKGDTERGQK
jgi:hypothetical protein